MRCVIVIALVIAALDASPGRAAETNPVNRHSAPVSQTMAHQIIVKLRTADKSSMRTLAKRSNLSLKTSRTLTGSLQVVEVSSAAAGESLESVLQRLRADPAVQYAEPDKRRFAHAAPDDPLYSGQWYLQKGSSTPSAIDAISAWDTTTGRSGVVMADLDTGIRFDHPDLQRAAEGGRVLPGYDFVTDANIANDGDGRDPDATDPGDWISSADAASAAFNGCSVADSSWHGTRTAGMLGALTNNSVGIAGINWVGWILPVRVLGKCGGVDSDILAAMLWAAGIHVEGVPDNPYPARIINMSLGAADTTCPQSYLEVINQLATKGVTVIASAGNEGGPVDTPANCSGVAGIAGLRHAGTKVGYSNLGPAIALSAPAGNCVNSTGSCVYSIDTTYNLGATTPGTDAYTDQTHYNIGTSFSAPLVVGIAGLMLAVNGNLNASQTIARLKEGTLPFPVSDDASIAQCHVPTSASDIQSSECNCTTQTCGAGLANAPQAVLAALRPIAAISLPAGVQSGQSVLLNASRSAAACDHAIVKYAWSVVAGSAGSAGISGADATSATVVAPSAGSFTVRLTVTDDTGRQDSADVVVGAASVSTAAPSMAGGTACLAALTVTSTGEVALSLSPTSAQLQAGLGTQQFSVQVTNSSNGAVSWYVNQVAGGDSTVGTISSNGLYTAPGSLPSPATVTVKAVLNADSTQTASAVVTLTDPVAVSVAPTSIALMAGSGTQRFVATVANSSNPTVTWSVQGVAGGNSSVGTITSDGLYTAPAAVPSPATVTVSARSVADTTRVASASVSIAAAARHGGGAMDDALLVALGVLLWGRIAHTRATGARVSGRGFGAIRWLLPMAALALSGCVLGYGRCKWLDPVKSSLTGKMQFRPSEAGTNLLGSTPVLMLDSPAYIYAPGLNTRCQYASEMQLIPAVELPTEIVDGAHVIVRGGITASSRREHVTRFVLNVRTLTLIK